MEQGRTKEEAFLSIEAVIQNNYYLDSAQIILCYNCQRQNTSRLIQCGVLLENITPQNIHKNKKKSHCSRFEPADFVLLYFFLFLNHT